MIKSYEELLEIAQDGYEKLFRASYIIDANIATQVLGALKVSKLEDEKVDPKTSMLVNLINLSEPEEMEKYATIYPDHVLAVLIHGIAPDGRKRLAFIAKAQGIKHNYDPLTITDQREKLSIPVEQLASLMNVPVETITAWETGNKIPDALELAALADHLEMTLKSFFILRKSNKLLKHVESAYEEEEEIFFTRKQKNIFLALEAICTNADKEISREHLYEMIENNSFPGLEGTGVKNIERYLNMFKKRGLIDYNSFGYGGPIRLTQRGLAVRAN